AEESRQPLGGRMLLKVYVREHAAVEAIRARIQQAHPDASAIYVAGDVCRRELLVEIEALRLHV
ncbi:MAG TPA: hypothetical protein VHK24_02640, partial [Steroidobacter sp.]|nr:hypothetical protein [Steroidobacter sp.]